MVRQSLFLLAFALPTISAFSHVSGRTSTVASSVTSTTARSLSKYAAPCVMGDESIMSQKTHGTSEVPVQKNLRWNCDNEVADRICNFNRHYAEYAGYWSTTDFIPDARATEGEINFYDSNTGKPLFVAPKGRDMESFLKESGSHGWPSFRDEEVNWDYVRVLDDGECVSVDGTHLGHNLPDGTGNRYCINLVSVAGNPKEE